jgi:hypothetical protein
MTMTSRMAWGAALLLLSLAAQSTMSCSEAERLYDCARICDGYADCIDDSIDRTDCTTTCEGKGQEDPDFAEQASDCEACIDDESCADAALQCASSCAPVVAAST